MNVSAHPPTLHDFGGFPQELFDQQYPALGAPDLAREVVHLLQNHHGEETQEWGLDHGAWSVLKSLFPKADVPVFQMSIDMSRDFAAQQEVGRALKILRERGVLVIASGNLVHNLPQVQWDGTPMDWAQEFDDLTKQCMENRDFGALAASRDLGELYRLAHPTPDHFMPAQYLAGLVDAKDDLSFFNEGIDLGTMSMRSYIYA